MIWQLIKKDFKRQLKNPFGFIILTSFPLLFALLLGLVFGSFGDDGEEMPRVKLLIEDHDESMASQFVTGVFGRGEMNSMFDTQSVEKGAGRGLMDDGKASALIIIPEGFADSLLHEHPASITLIKNPSEAFAPKIAEETLLILTEGGSRLLRIGEKPIRLIRKQMDSEGDPSDAAIALIAIQINKLIRRTDDYIFPPLIAINEGESGEEVEDETSMAVFFTYLLTGILVMFLLFLLEAQFRDLFHEQEQRTLHRLLISPAGINGFICSKLLYLYIIGLFSYGIVWLAAALFAGVTIPSTQIIPFILFSLLMIAALVSVIGMLYALVKNRMQAMSAAPVMIIIFSMLGGSMIPLSSLPGFVRKISIISPVYWGVDGMQKILLDHSPFADVRIHFLVMGLLFVVFMTPTLILFHRKFRV